MPSKLVLGPGQRAQRGSSRALTGMSAGGFSLSLGPYHSVVMQKRRGGADLDVSFPEPIPARLSDIHGILKGARYPYAAMLFIDFMVAQFA